MKLDRRINDRERRFKICDILKQLGLSQCMNTRIGLNGDSKVLSGGEKKRLAFATEVNLKHRIKTKIVSQLQKKNR